jgi:hypothetical protein
MADIKPFAGLSQEDTAVMLLMLLSSILDKLPRTDANDRLITNPSEIAGPVTISSGTVTTVSTVTALTTAADVNRVNSMGTSAATDAIPLQISNFGAAHIYNMIEVT